MGLFNVFRAIDLVGLATLKFLRKQEGEATSSRAEVVEQARSHYDRLMGRFDVMDRVPSRILEVAEGEEKWAEEFGAVKDEETGQWMVPDDLPLEDFKEFWPKVAPDLNDKTSRMLTTSDGRTIEGYIDPNWVAKGSDSTATSLLFGGFVAVGALAFLGFSITPLLGMVALLLTIPFFIAMVQHEDGGDALFGLGALTLTPFVMALFLSGVVASPEVGINLNAVGNEGAFDSLMDSSLVMLGGVVGIIASIITVIAGACMLLDKETRKGAIGVISIGLVLPVAVVVVFVISAVMSALGAGISALYAPLLLTGAVLMAVFGGSDDDGGISNTYTRLRKNILWAIGITVFSTIVEIIAGFIGMPSLNAFTPFAVASVYPMVYTQSNFVSLTKLLKEQGEEYTIGRMGGEIMTAHIPARQKQAKAAHEDKTPFLAIGVATGHLTRKKFPYAPDAGTTMGLTSNDLSTHLIIFGETGGGKTSSFLRPLAYEWVSKKAGGALFLCGKNALAGDLSTLITMMVEPGIPLGLIEGMDAQAVANAINGMTPPSEKKGSDSIWSETGMAFVEHLTVLHEALRDHEYAQKRYALDEVRLISLKIDTFQIRLLKAEKMGDAQMVASLKDLIRKLRTAQMEWQAEADRDRRWLWNITTLNDLRLLVEDVNETKSGTATIGHKFGAVLDWLGWMPDASTEERRQQNARRLAKRPDTIHPDLLRPGTVLSQACRYFTNDWLKKTPGQRSSFIMNVEQNLSPLLRGKYLNTKADGTGTPWHMLEKGINVESVLYGEKMGINLPDIIHGKAGNAITSLIKERIYANIRKRGSKSEKQWQAEGQVPVMVMIDESQLVVGDSENELLTIARSLGLRFVNSTQTYENLLDVYGDKAGADRFCNSHLSLGSLKTSDETYNYLTRRFGVHRLVKFESPVRGLDYMGALLQVINSPLNDLNHPNRPALRQIERLGAGTVISTRAQHQVGQKVGVQWGSHKRLSITGEDISRYIVANTGGHIEAQPLFLPEEFSALLEEKGNAILHLKRAGSIRADVVNLNFIDQYKLRAEDDVNKEIAVQEGINPKDLVERTEAEKQAGNVMREAEATTEE